MRRSKPEMRLDGPPGDEALLVLGEASDGRIVHVSEVARGRTCGCICPNCHSALIARKGEVRAHHFAHLPDQGCEPWAAIAAALRAHAAQVIDAAKSFALPAVIAEVEGFKKTIRGTQVVPVERASIERANRRRRPDLVLEVKGRRLLIEIAVRQRVGGHRVAEIVEGRIASVELDLRRLAVAQDPAELRRAILEEAPRHWLFNELAETEREAIRKQRAAEEAARHEKHARHGNMTAEEQIEADLAALMAALTKFQQRT